VHPFDERTFSRSQATLAVVGELQLAVIQAEARSVRRIDQILYRSGRLPPK